MTQFEKTERDKLPVTSFGNEPAFPQCETQKGNPFHAEHAADSLIAELAKGGDQ